MIHITQKLSNTKKCRSKKATLENIFYKLLPLIQGTKKSC